MVIDIEHSLCIIKTIESIMLEDKMIEKKRMRIKVRAKRVKIKLQEIKHHQKVKVKEKVKRVK